MVVSIIVVSYHTGEVLFEAIESILKQQDLLELIIVDNGNDDDTKERIIAIGNPSLKLVSGHGNIGFGAGCNLGASHTNGKYLLFINPDCVIREDDILPKLCYYYDHNPKTILAGVKILNKDHSLQRTTIRNIITPLNAILESLHISNINIKAHNIDQVIEVPAITGCCMFISKDNYARLKGFDEDYFLHFEDMDLCYRAGKIGKIIYIPQIEIIHYLSTSKVSSNFIELCKAKSCYLYFKKHFNNPIIYLLLLMIYVRLTIKMAVNLLCKL